MFILYIISSFISWHKFLEVKTIKVENIGNRNKWHNNGVDEKETMVTIYNNGESKPEMLKNSISDLREGYCYSGVIEGISSFYQDRWLKSAIKIDCPK
jgi:hypothetical protein